jgi:hypothetical protein
VKETTKDIAKAARLVWKNVSIKQIQTKYSQNEFTFCNYKKKKKGS